MTNPIRIRFLTVAGQPIGFDITPEIQAQILRPLMERIEALERVSQCDDATARAVGEILARPPQENPALVQAFRENRDLFEQQDAKPCAGSIAGGDPSLCLIHGTEQQDAKP